jgi:hypothetical protein
MIDWQVMQAMPALFHRFPVNSTIYLNFSRGVLKISLPYLHYLQPAWCADYPETDDG